MPIVRLMIFRKVCPSGEKLYLRREMNVEIPMMNMKKGKTRSVGVRPLHFACSKGAKTYSEPGLLTRIMPQIVMPLRISRARMRFVLVLVMMLLFIEVIFLGKFFKSCYIFVPIVAHVLPAIAAGKTLTNLSGTTYDIKHSEATFVSYIKNSFVRIECCSFLHDEELNICEGGFAIVEKVNLYALNLFIFHCCVKRFKINRAEPYSRYFESIQTAGEFVGIHPRCC